MSCYGFLAAIQTYAIFRRMESAYGMNGLTKTASLGLYMATSGGHGRMGKGVLLTRLLMS